jgi:dipeptidyl-peptidase 4
VDTFPRQHARTRRFALGEPRTITVSPDGERVVFLRSDGGSDPVTHLWVLDPGTGEERRVADARALLGGGEEDLPPAERARRERAREQAGGITAYATDGDVRVAAFALGGRLFGAGLLSGSAREIPVEGPVFDPRPDPTARRVAYVSGRQLRVAELDGTWRTVAGEDDVDISWGSAEFVAAEEMGRSRGYWWSPDGERLAAARVDLGPVARWYIADPSNPGSMPSEHAYPRAGTPNAEVTLHVVGLDGSRVDVTWDRERFPYLAEVSWPQPDLLLVTVEDRAQQQVQVLAGDPATGATRPLVAHLRTDWVELVAGTPAWLDGAVVTAADIEGSRRLCIDGEPVTPPELQVRAVLATPGGSVLFQANPVADPTVLHVHRWSAAGLEAVTTEPGVHTAAQGGATVVVRSASLEHDGIRTMVLGGPTLVSHAEAPLVRPRAHLLRGGERRLATAVLLPDGVGPDDSSVRLPVLLDPYGGPHAQRVQCSRAQYLTSQWFADQGFAVVVADGRGTPGRGTDWERAVRHDLAGPVLEDQVDALHAAAERYACLDLSRVGIRGWSFGGYLAALAVLRRPDVFHAAVAGAPVTEWRLYDTHYTERYLGDPEADPEAYDRSSLLFDAAALERPLLLVHGLADDNVVAAHTLQLSSALLAAGRPHSVLPLVGVTHMAPQEQVAENLLLLQLDFLRRSLGISPS